MRSKEEIQKELDSVNARIQTYKSDMEDYNGDPGPDRYMFFVTSAQLINGLKTNLSTLEKELNTHSANSTSSNPST
jgi:hypothetical protein